MNNKNTYHQRNRERLLEWVKEFYENMFQGSKNK